MKLKVKITKEILRKSMMCGVVTNDHLITNCAVALAVRDIFPHASVIYGVWTPFFLRFNNASIIDSTHDADDFLSSFDSLRQVPLRRLELPETEVTLDITDEILEELNKNHNWQEIVNNIDHLELVN